MRNIKKSFLVLLRSRVAALKPETKIRMFVFITAGIFIMSAAVGQTWRKNYAYHAVFAAVSGLKDKAPVKYGGKDVGVVDKIRFINRSPDEIYEVDIMVRRKIKIRVGSIVSIKTAGFIGDAYLDITPGDKDSYFNPDVILPTTKTIGHMEIMEMTRQNVELINLVLTNLLRKESGEEIFKILVNIQGITRALKQQMNNERADLLDESKSKVNPTPAIK